MKDTWKRNANQPFFFQQWESEQHIFIVNTLIFSKQVQYSLRDEDFDYIHEMEDMEDSSEGEESIDGDVFED
jgi:hypothetical protein